MLIIIHEEKGKPVFKCKGLLHTSFIQKCILRHYDVTRAREYLNVFNYAIEKYRNMKNMLKIRPEMEQTEGCRL